MVQQAALLGTGIFGWSSTERVSNRYGSIHLGAETVDGRGRACVSVDHQLLTSFIGKRAKLTAIVTSTRKSAHDGDLFIPCLPSTPKKGDIALLGVGVLSTYAGDDGLPDIVLMPDDQRVDYWFDPRTLYRLHDQTVDVFIEETNERSFARAELPICTLAAISLGNGYFQIKDPAIPAEGPGSYRVLPKHVPLSWKSKFFQIQTIGESPRGTVFDLERVLC